MATRSAETFTRRGAIAALSTEAARIGARFVRRNDPLSRESSTTSRRSVVGFPGATQDLPAETAIGAVAIAPSPLPAVDHPLITEDNDPIHRPLLPLAHEDDPLTREEMRSLATVQGRTIARLEEENAALRSTAALQGGVILDLRERASELAAETIEQGRTIDELKRSVREKSARARRAVTSVSFPRRDLLWAAGMTLATTAPIISWAAHRTGDKPDSAQSANVDGKLSTDSLDANVSNTIEDGIIPGPFLTKLKNMNIFVDLNELNTHVDKTGSVVSGITVMYTDGRPAQTIGIDRTGGDPIRGTVKDIDGVEFLHLQLHPTDKPAFVTFNTDSRVSPNPYSEPVPIKIKTPDYLLTDPNDRKRVYYDSASAPEWKLREIHEFLKEFDFLGILPDLAIRKTFGTPIETSPQASTTPLSLPNAEISLSAELFDSEQWKQILAYEIGKYFYRQSATLGDASISKAVAELEYRIANSNLAYHLSTSMRNEKGVYDTSLPSVYDEVLNPTSYDPSLEGKADFSMSPEHATGNFLLLVTNPQYASEMMKRYYSLYYLTGNDDSTDVTLSDRAVASTFLYPLYKMYFERRENAPKQFIDALTSIGATYQVAIPRFDQFPISSSVASDEPIPIGLR